MYNKLFTKILDSTVWLEDDATRLVWITFLAVMDEDGFVALSAVGNVAARARVSLDAAEAAVRTLEGPDTINSAQEHEGRRIERVPYGWMVLNSKKYRDIIKRETAREQTRERVAKFRAKQKGISVTECNEKVTPSDTEADTDTNNYIVGQKPDVVPIREQIKTIRTEAIQVLDFLNLRTGKAFRHVESNLKPIESILKSGVCLQDMKTVTMRKIHDWQNDPKMSQYLRPSTLYRRSNFEQYLGQTLTGGEHG